VKSDLNQKKSDLNQKKSDFLKNPI